tara:strand:+ start:514 stop:789 length:276 start_codon:yes stop_codon:yes gene_type:complete
MKISRNKLRNIINSIINERSIFDTGVREREIGGSSFEAAQDDAKENGKAYYVDRPGRVIEFDKDGHANVLNISEKEAFDKNDGTVHYKGDL